MRYIVFLCLSLLTFSVYGQEYLPFGFSQYQIQIPSNNSDWFETDIVVKEEDFVVFEVDGIINLGAYAGNATGEGIASAYLPFFNRFPNRLQLHGTLTCKNGGKIMFARNSGNTYSLSDLTEVERITWGIGFSEKSFTGNYFVSEATQKLKFAVNDKDYSNNSGSFSIKITVIPLAVHTRRNQYNKCPYIEPYCDGNLISCKGIDSKKNVWTKATKEKIYHGGGMTNFGLYRTYRGENSLVSGCQCTYDTDGKLVNDDYMGTYDFAFAEQGRIISDELMKYHTLWDVFPHDAFINFFEEKGKHFKYEITKNRF